jgi:hypothetical protein
MYVWLFLVAAFLEPEFDYRKEFWLLVMPGLEKSHWQDAGYFTKAVERFCSLSHNMAAIKQLCTKQLF